MYGISLRSGRYLRSAAIQRALADLPLECGTELHKRRMQQLGAIESLEARGMKYSNQDFDVLSSSLNFLDAVAPDAAEGLRQQAEVALPAKVGESIDFKAHGRVWFCKRVDRSTYFLAVCTEGDGRTDRARFGTAQEITEDIGHVLLTGVLPRSKSPVA